MLLKYEGLLQEIDQHLYVYEQKLPNKIKGLQGDNVIWINKALSNTEKYCILAEELGHYHTSYGNITDQSKLTNRKQEKRARSWAYEETIPLSKIVQAHKARVKDKHELAEFLEVTEDFLEDALDRYKEKYGIFVEHEGHTICFEPLGVMEWFE